MDNRTIWNKQEGPSDTSAEPDTMMFEAVECKVEPPEDSASPDGLHEPQIDTAGGFSISKDHPVSIKKEKGLVPENDDIEESEPLPVKADEDLVLEIDDIKESEPLHVKADEDLMLEIDDIKESGPLHVKADEDLLLEIDDIKESEPLHVKADEGLVLEIDDIKESEPLHVTADEEEPTTACAPGSKRREITHHSGYTDREVLEIHTRSDSECEFDGSSDVSPTESRSASPRPLTATAYRVDDLGRSAVGHYSDSEDSETDGDNFGKRSRLYDTFDWKQTNFQPIKHTFDDSASGNKCELVKDSSILSFFMVFVSEDLLQFIADETNRYYTYSKANTPESFHSRLSKWRDTGIEELYCFIAICLLMAQVKKPKMSDYWSKDMLLNTPVFSEIMSRDRFILLLKMLHFSDNTVSTGGDNLFKIRNIVNKVRTTFHDAFSPHEKLCIDKSLFLFKDQLYYKQFIPSKRSRFGIQTFVLCDCKTGYILDFIVYTGAETEIWFHNLGKSGDIVATLMRPYLEKGHTLYVNSSYSSPDLFLWLHNHRTNVCGFVHKNTLNVPKLQRKLKRGEIDCKATDKMLVIKWCEKKEVLMLTTCNTSDLIETEKTDQTTGKKIQKPQCVVDYNSAMASVDRCDMVLTSVGSAHKSVKWYKKYFFHILDLCILNAHTLHRAVTGQRMVLAEFHLGLVREIVEKYATQRSKGGRGRHSCDENPLRLMGRHFPDFIATEYSKKRRPMRRCIVCSKQKVRRETRYQCKRCSVALCVVPCFEIYHTKKYY